MLKKKIGEVRYYTPIKQINDKYGAEKSRVEYRIKTGVVTLLDENNNPFLESKLDIIKVIDTYFSNESRKSEILIKNIEMCNKMNLGTDAVEYKRVLQQQQDYDRRQPIFKMSKKFFATAVTKSKAQWFVYDEYDVKVNPLIIKLTDELYDKFYCYFFDKSLK